MSSASYLQPLVAPLRFLAQSDFARLSTVKGLDALVRTALAGARAARSGEDVALLERVARALEPGGPESPQQALRALVPRVRETESSGGTAAPGPRRPESSSVRSTPARGGAAGDGRGAQASRGPAVEEAAGTAGPATGRDAGRHPPIPNRPLLPGLPW